MTGCSRGLGFFGLAVWSLCEAIAQPAIDLTVTPAWNGWTRPGQATEVDVRMRAGAAMPAAVTITSGAQTSRTEIQVEPGRAVRLHVPVGAAESISVTAQSPGAMPVRREVAIAQAESPLLAVAIASEEAVSLRGFHKVALNADDLPRNASAYSSIAALVLDGQTFGALDQRQLAALLGHTAACGRAVLVNADLRPRRVVESAAGCGGRFLMNATSMSEASEMLRASFAVPVADPIPLATLGGLTRSDRSTWHRVLVIVAAYFGAAALVLTFSSSIVMLLLLPVLATLTVWGSLHVMQPASRLLVWAEAESGERVARYEARQQFAALARTNARMPVLSELGSVRACDADGAVRFDLDAKRGMATHAEFDTRLFQRVSLCYSGSFPASRSVAINARPEGALDVRNTGTLPWPAGLLLARQHAHDLPALAPGEAARISPRMGSPRVDVVARTALSRTPADGEGALWQLDLSGITNTPIETTAWLFVSIPAR